MNLSAILPNSLANSFSSSMGGEVGREGVGAVGIVAEKDVQSKGKRRSRNFILEVVMNGRS